MRFLNLNNKKFVNFIFSVFVVLTFLSFVWTFFVYSNDFEIPLLGHKNADIIFNIEFKDKTFAKNVHFKAGKVGIPFYETRVPNSYMGAELNKIPVYNLKIKFDGEPSILAEKTDNIVLTVDRQLYYYKGSDILNFKKAGDNEFLFPDNVKYSAKSKYITDKGSLKQMQICFLSFFYNMKYFVLTYIFLLTALSIYLLNKNKITLGFNLFKNHAIWWILLLAFLLRIADNGFAFWSDELYTATAAGNPDLPFMFVFSDPGNPPLFFILARYWQKIFGQNESLLRLLPCIFSVISIYFLYVLVKKYTNKNTALLASFLLTINIYSIQTAQEFRCYSLCALFSVLSVYYLLKIIEEKKNRDILIYGILSVLMANTHYFQILILTGNFILAMFFLDNKTRLKFFTANLIAALSFLPYFIMTGLNKGLLKETFNVLAKPLASEILRNYFEISLGITLGLMVIVISLLLLVPKIRNYIFEFKNNKFLILWGISAYNIIFLFVSSYLFSILIKPVIRGYYYYMLAPLYTILLALCIMMPIKRRTIKCIFSIIFIFCYFSFTMYFGKTVLYSYKFEQLFKYAYFDSLKYAKEGKKVAIALHDTDKYRLFYKDFLRGYEEFIEYGGVDLYAISKLIKEADADTIYCRIKLKYLSELVDFCRKFGDVSFVRVDKDILVLRINKGA